MMPYQQSVYLNPELKAEIEKRKGEGQSFSEYVRCALDNQFRIEDGKPPRTEKERDRAEEANADD